MAVKRVFGSDRTKLQIFNRKNHLTRIKYYDILIYVEKSVLLLMCLIRNYNCFQPLYFNNFAIIQLCVRIIIINTQKFVQPFEKICEVDNLKIKKFYKYSLTVQTMIITVLVSIATVGIVSGIAYKNVRDRAISNLITQYELLMEQLMEHEQEKAFEIYDIFRDVEIDAEFKRIASVQDGLYNVSDAISAATIFSNMRTIHSNVINSLIFIRDDGQIFYEKQNVLNNDIDYHTLEWYKNAEDNNGYAIWYPPYTNELFTNDSRKSIGLMKFITDNRYTREGLLIMNINTEYLRDEIDRLNLSSPILISSKNGDILTSNADEQICAEIKEDMKEITLENGVRRGRKSCIITKQADKIKWNVAVKVDNNILAGDLGIMQNGILTATITGIIIALVMMLFVLVHITVPVTKLSRAMRVSDGTKPTLYDGTEAEREDEIGGLAKSYNEMVVNIKNLTEHIKQKSSQESKARLRTLQQQINSHFLYNTLDSIYWKVAVGDKEQSMDMILRLATYFRLALNKGDDITTVENELMHIENYIEIEKYRYKNEFRCIIDVDKAAYRCKLPKLLLQPLVENAVLHGLLSKHENAVVKVTGRMSEENLIFDVEDNGVGMNIDEVDNYVKKGMRSKNLEKSFALRNIYTRIKLYGGARGDISFFESSCGGAGIKITLPIGEFSEQTTILRRKYDENDYC